MGRTKRGRLPCGSRGNAQLSGSKYGEVTRSLCNPLMRDVSPKGNLQTEGPQNIRTGGIMGPLFCQLPGQIRDSQGKPVDPTKKIEVQNTYF